MLAGVGPAVAFPKVPAGSFTGASNKLAHVVVSSLGFRAVHTYNSEKNFVSQERVSVPGPDLRGSLGTSQEVREFPGKAGKLPGNLWIAVKFHSGRTSGEVAGELRSPGTFQKLGGA